MIDLRSDTVTKPCQNMRQAMAQAEVGDDVYDGDPTVVRLQNMAADMLGKEAALFVPSGTQANLLALLCHCERGDEYIVGQQSHTYKYEGGGAAVLGSIQPQPIEFEKDGRLDLNKAARFVKPYDPHFAKSKLLCLENTLSGKILPVDYLYEARAFCDNHGLSLHLDGARVFNAAVALNIDVKKITRPFDTVSVCLSKGLGCPVGSLLLGNRELLKRAVHWRKMLGGGMRQAGIVAAAGIYALQNNVKRLEIDHDNARTLAKGLSGIDELKVDMDEVQTNMVFIDIPENGAADMAGFMAEQGIRMFSGKKIRLVTHLDINETDLGKVVLAFKRYYETKGHRCSA
ncbi:MAG: low-specificity L-threonine aldolase [Alphaproteobacteria bacterium]|nr:low-specificity L-threonine aldolase [Alphaproteobacteria bacterium]